MNKHGLNDTLPIVVDMMGGEHGGSVLFKGILRYIKRFSDKQNCFTLVGDESLLNSLRRATPGCHRKRFNHIYTHHTIKSDDKPADVLRANHTDSSMYQALKLLASGKARACVSSGNSGVLLSLAQKYLGLLPDVSRLAICCRIPTLKKGYSYMLDVGGTINLSPRRLLQLAKLICQPQSEKTLSVGLLNIGTVSNKGTEYVQEADTLLRADPDISYKGFIEGYSLFSGEVDVILCEGFAGNLVLKSIEGSSNYVSNILDSNWMIRLLSPFLRRTFMGLDARCFNGAILLGLRAPVIKSHSKADATAFAHAVELATHPM